MTIQRQYSLPNCKLVVQGLSNDTADSLGRPSLSVVTNVECYLAGQKVALTGGRTFLENLAATVSDYAQSYLSGIQHLIRRNRHQQDGMVQLQQVGHNLHRLTVRPEPDQPGETAEVNLTTVQLFDLVEALDQLFADAQTLPEMVLSLKSLPKRYVTSQEPVAQRAVPVVIGFSSLAAVAALLFMLPVPEARRPETTNGASSNTSTEQTSNASPTPVATGSPSATASPTTNSDTTTSSTTSGDTSTTASSSKGVGLDLADVPEITDPTELDRLTVQLYDKLDLAWKKTPTFDGELVYRVGVSPDGDIVGYKYANDASLTYLSDTPLADIQFASPSTSEDATSEEASSDNASPTADSTDSSSDSSSPSSTTKEPTAQFRVVFKSDGVLEVSPWDGQPLEDQTTSEETTSTP